MSSGVIEAAACSIPTTGAGGAAGGLLELAQAALSATAVSVRVGRVILPPFDIGA
jgi:hypothetical protein